MITWKFSDISLSVVAIFLIAATGCQKENSKPRDYPRFMNTRVANVSDSGAFFFADLYSLGTEKIIRSGFVWDLTTNYLNIDQSNKIILELPTAPGVFSCEVKSAMIKDRDYYVKPFIQTDKRMVYGPSATFRSLGSLAPVITGFYPLTAEWSDTIMIRGKNFSFKYGDNILKLGNTPCLIISSTDTTLKAQVSFDVSSIKNLLSVEIAGNTAIYIKDTFKLIPPVIYDYFPKSGYWGDTIQMTGKYFKFFMEHNTDSVKIGKSKCAIVSNNNDIIKFTVSNDVSSVSNPLSMKIGGLTLSNPASFTLLTPQFTMSPKSGNRDDRITLTGRFNTSSSRNKVYLNNTPANIVSTTSKQMIISIPALYPDSQAVVKYIVDPFVINSTDTFRINPPVIDSFNPTTGQSGTEVHIFGRYFTPANYYYTKVYFGGVETPVLYLSATEAVTNVPIGINGPVIISVKVFSQKGLSVDFFNVTNPLIKSVSPLSGTFGDTVTVTGQNFVPNNTSVYFDGYVYADIISMSSTRIIIKVPSDLDSLPRAINIITGTQYMSVKSSDKFVLSPISVTGVSPASYSPGSDITITGNNFNPVASYNKLYWDIYPLTVKSATPNQLVATWPTTLPRGTNGIKVITGGYTRTSTEKVTVISPWLRIQAPAIHTNSNVNYGLTINNFGYIVSTSSGATFKFDASTGNWRTINGFPYFTSNTDYPACTVLNDTVYIIGGYSWGNTYLTAFNTKTETWRTISKSPTYLGVAFTLNNKLYFGLDAISAYYPSSRKFWEIDPMAGYSFVEKGDLPIDMPGIYASYFTLNNKGYMVLQYKQVWQFDPDLLVWTRKSDFPGPPRRDAVSFVLNGTLYFGTGINDTVYKDIWKYDPDTDTWAYVTDMPLPRHQATAFSINGKCYIGFGMSQNWDDMFDFYEFDPSYLSK